MPNRDFRFGISSSANGVDLNQLLVEHGPSTFFMRVADDLPELELHAKDILVIDRALQPRKSDVVVVALSGDSELKIVRFDQMNEELELWGVASKVIRDLRP